jgi:fatty-acyl-CoA synthase
MTEASPLITINSPSDSFEKRTQTIGKGLEQTEIKIVDNKGRIVKVNETGELLVRGYNTMLGYWNDKQKTDETYTQDRFLKTGY